MSLIEMDFRQIKPFRLSANYDEKIPSEYSWGKYHHSHKGCEIYVNLTGDVSFMVESTIYPISSGDVIITRPYESHHCIFHSNELHRHYCVNFSSNGNEELLDLFYNRKSGEKNLLIFSEKNKTALFSLLQSIIFNPTDSLEQYLHFFQLLTLINGSTAKKSLNIHIRPEIATAIDYIDRSLKSQISISISELAQNACMSLNTFERNFKMCVGMSPRDYIRQKRLDKASLLLVKGHSVHEACMQCGFSDYSQFISLFKKQFGKTPLQYKKSAK